MEIIGIKDYITGVKMIDKYFIKLYINIDMELSHDEGLKEAYDKMENM